MRLLLDTHVFLWSKSNDRRMSDHAWSLLRDPGNELLMSAVSVAEMAIKIRLGRLTLDVPLKDFVKTGMTTGRILELPLVASHAARLADLPLHHRDPFDRLLIATAIEEDLTLLTNDPEIRKYFVQTTW